MDELFTLREPPVFLRREALSHGYDDRALTAGLRDGRIARVRHGAYTDARTWARADAVEQYRMKGQAVLLTHRDVALTHTSAAAHHYLRLWGVDLSKVHATRLDGNRGTPSSDVQYHHGELRPEDLVVENGCRVVTPVRAAVETAMLNSVEAGVCCIDTLLDPRLDLPGVQPVELEEVHAMARRFGRWPGAQRLQITARLVRRGSQSVGESRSRCLCWRYHLPAPELQWTVRDGSTLVGVCDFAWPDRRLLGEFDGKAKYFRGGDHPDRQPGDIVFEEKKREDRIRSVTGFSMARWTWSDLHPAHQAATASYIRSRLFRSA